MRGQTLEVTEDVADRNQDGLTRWRKTQGKWVVEIGERVLRIEVVGDICLRRPRRPPRAVEPMTMMMMMIVKRERKPTRCNNQMFIINNVSTFSGIIMPIFRKTVTVCGVLRCNKRGKSRY